jgi:RNA polymerase-binding transcription factor DksA
MARALDADEVATHRDLFTAGTSREDQERLTSRLAKVRRARRSIDAGTYGRCLTCRTAIDVALLTSMPTSTQCGRCVRDPHRPWPG